MMLVSIPKEKCFEELYLFYKISEELTGDELFKLISEYVRCKPDIMETLCVCPETEGTMTESCKGFYISSYYKLYVSRNIFYSSQ